MTTSGGLPVNLGVGRVRELLGDEVAPIARRKLLGPLDGPGQALLDESGEITGLKDGVFGPPTVYVVDRQGRLLARGAGPRDWSSPAARNLLEDVLGPPGRAAEPPAPRNRRA